MAQNWNASIDTGKSNQHEWSNESHSAVSINQSVIYVISTSTHVFPSPWKAGNEVLKILMMIPTPRNFALL